MKLLVSLAEAVLGRSIKYSGISRLAGFASGTETTGADKLG
jgi:hypothetical protein